MGNAPRIDEQSPEIPNKSHSSSVDKTTKYACSIIGLYTTLVFVASRVLRGVFSGICFKIMFEDLPNVDRILQLCLDVYLVREAGEFSLEEDLFAKLVFLFRSPETLIKWSRPKEELEDDDNPEGEEGQ